jgi:hypothetical protein
MRGPTTTGYAPVRLSWTGVLSSMLLLACGDAPYEPTPERLLGEFSGRAGTGFETYDLFLAVDQVSDSVRGLWSLSFTATCATHDGPFSGVLQGDQLRLRLRPDEAYEATLDLVMRVLPGDSVLTGRPILVAAGSVPEGSPALCGSDSLTAVTLHAGEVAGLPAGR